MIHVILHKEEVQTTIDGMKLAVAFLKKQENGEHFIEPYLALQNKMEGLQDAINYQAKKENTHETSQL
jgi:hypothetical protein